MFTPRRGSLTSNMYETTPQLRWTLKYWAYIGLPLGGDLCSLWAIPVEATWHPMSGMFELQSKYIIFTF